MCADERLLYHLTCLTHTSCAAQDIAEEYLHEISPRYTARTYNLLSHNCNHFSDEFATFLVGQGVPERIMSIPQEVMASPLGPLLGPVIDQMQAQLGSVGGGGF